MLVNIDVEVRHIEHGNVNACGECPGALAIAEKLKPGCSVWFSGYEEVGIRHASFAGGTYCEVPQNFIEWQYNHLDWYGAEDAQSGERPEPISFYLEIPDEFLNEKTLATH